MYQVRCSECGGDEAPIVSGKHLSTEYCDSYRQKAIKTLERIESGLIDKINSQMPGDCTPDRIAIPKLNRLEERQMRLEEAFRVIKAELGR